MGETMETVADFIFLGSKITADGDCSHEIKRCLLIGREAMTNLDSILKSQDITDKGLSSQSCGFPSSHICMWELDDKKSWVLNNWCFWTVVLGKTRESPLDIKIKLVHPKGNQSWIFIGRTDAEAPVLWPPDAKNWLLGKDPDAGKDWRREEKGTTEDEMVGWHHQLNEHELSKLWEMVKDRKAWHAAVHEVAKSWTWLSGSTATTTVVSQFLAISSSVSPTSSFSS